LLDLAGDGQGVGNLLVLDSEKDQAALCLDQVGADFQCLAQALGGLIALLADHVQLRKAHVGKW